MGEYSEDDAVFRDINSFYRRLMESMLKDLQEFESSVGGGPLKGTWDVKPINQPGVKGYVARGQFHSGNLPMLAPKSDLTEEPRDPLTDVFEEKDCVKVYLELPGIEKSDIQLNVTDTVMEIKARNFSKTVKLPNVDVDSEKASASYKNGVLEVTVPKVQRTIDEEKKRTIRID